MTEKRVLLHPLRPDWPTTREGVIADAVRYDGGKWPDQLSSGVMYHMGERITRAEFESAAIRSLSSTTGATNKD